MQERYASTTSLRPGTLPTGISDHVLTMANIYKALAQDHKRFANLLTRLESSDGPRFDTLLSTLEREIYGHDRFEQRVLHELACEKLGDDNRISTLSDQHDELDRRFHMLHTVSSAQEKKLLIPDLRAFVLEHMSDEESQFLPDIQNRTDEKTSDILGKEYARVRREGREIPVVGNIPAYITVVVDLERILHQRHITGLEINIKNLSSIPSKNLDYAFTGPNSNIVTLSVSLATPPFYGQLVLISHLLADIMKALSDKGIDVLEELTCNHIPLATVASLPSADSLVVQGANENLDPTRQNRFSFNGLHRMRRLELPDVLYDKMRTSGVVPGTTERPKRWVFKPGFKEEYAKWRACAVENAAILSDGERNSSAATSKKGK